MKDLAFTEGWEKAIRKKQYMIEHDQPTFIGQSIYAGVYLTLVTMCATFVGNYFASIHPDSAKFMYSIIFPIGLVIIVFMNAELATSNMMYAAVGAHRKLLTMPQVLKIIGFCVFFNLIGATITSFLMSLTSGAHHIAADSFLLTMIDGKLNKPVLESVVEAILANMFVNIAIIGQLKIKESLGKIVFICLAIFLFVFFGYEHVIANFGLYTFAMFIGHPVSLTTVLFKWAIVLIGNIIGGSLIMGLTYSWLNRDQ